MREIFDFTRLNTENLSLPLVQPTVAPPAPLPVVADWDLRKAAHLLRRTSMCPHYGEISKAAAAGLNATLDLLLADLPPSPPPVKYRTDDDEYVGYGKTWINTNYRGKNAYRGQSLNAWYALNRVATYDQTNIRNRMLLFWSDYFGISGLRSDHRAIYKQFLLFEQLGTGNLRTMLERITVEPRMLDFLDGKVNNKSNPNENFGRELMELFTIGKGALAGPGDYTTFTEQDVTALARCFTGWTNRDYLYAKDNTPVESYFDANNHDTGDKQMSHRFNNRIIKNGGSNEYKEVIGILLDQDETARNFCRKLYRYFVYYDIDSTVEREVIQPLAATMIQQKYEIKPVLRQLLSSAHFYETSIQGAMLKNPQEFVTSCLRPFKEYAHDKRTEDINLRYNIGRHYADMFTDLNLDVQQAPTVSGWKAYYDAPQYYRHWISPSLMQYRYAIAERLVNRGFQIDRFLLDIDLNGFLESFPGKYDIDQFLREVVLVFIPRELSAAQMSNLKEKLMQGIDDREWGNEVRDFFANINDREYYNPMQKRLRLLITSVFSLAEFQLQ